MAHPLISTNVRSSALPRQALRLGFRLLGPRAPELAARYAERLFLTARKHPRPEREREVLAAAVAGRVTLDGGFVPTWTWEPLSSATLFSREPFSRQPAKAVLLVHGWEGRGSQLAPFVAPLTDRGFRVVTFDAPGHGDSPLRRASVVEHAWALSLVAQAVGPLHAIVSHSVGGAAALLATRAGLSATRLALVAPPAGPARFASEFAASLGLDRQTKEAMMERVRWRYGLSLRDLEVVDDAARTHVPLLVIHDEGDRIVAHADGAAIASAAPAGRLLSTRGLGHHRILRDSAVVSEVVAFVTGETDRSSLPPT